ncbi:hypothetical protein PHYBOEH_011724 [Phytophthora boehmeriae]|uniref:Large-conductance mechanosensitive channel n=1 Tax=Phytophthora boehmeriae TaxID=109152 RepID=A0A8T1X329_9STRA|nr:hypothetical protein PHYBOEH_011724 [Phytophthora boehmeriae]
MELVEFDQLPQKSSPPTSAPTTSSTTQKEPQLTHSKQPLTIKADDVDEVLQKVAVHLKAIAPHEDIRALVADFKNFIRRGNIVDLAIGMIMGTSFTAILQSLVQDILSPILSLMSTRGAITINYGLFFENVVHFFINALFLYFAVKRATLVISRLNAMMKRSVEKVISTDSTDNHSAAASGSANAHTAQSNKIAPTESK